MPTVESMLAKRMNVAITAKKAKIRVGAPGEGTSFAIRRINAGNLVLPSGRICVNDAYSADKFPPLNRIVAAGKFPVEFVIAKIPQDLPMGNDRGAFAIVTFSKARVTSWEPVTAVEAADPCFTNEIPNGIVQEGGTALFSPEAGAVHFALLHQQFDQRVEEIRQYENRFGCINYRPGEYLANVVICKGGFGDGDYRCFVGLTKVGRVARLVIDFGIGDPATA